VLSDPGMSDLTYSSYLCLPDLLNLQRPRSSNEDEFLFIIVHQTCELWFKQTLNELNKVRDSFTVLSRSPHSENQLYEAGRRLQRCCAIMRLVTEEFTILETMLPTDFLSFRGVLRTASAAQSEQFHRIEFLCDSDRGLSRGCWDASLNDHIPYQHPRELSLRELFFCAIRAAGFLDTPPREKEKVERQLSERRSAAIVKLYSTRSLDWILVCEQLIEFDELTVAWRVRHVLLVERMIGSSSGTAGSDGADHLKASLNRKFFPELWEARTMMARGIPHGDQR
jgi:tryptophan 2,3-dioxygenase